MNQKNAQRLLTYTLKKTRKFCFSGRVWVARQLSLADAWKTCQRGSWMAWWLDEFCRVDRETLRHLKPESCRNLYDAFDENTPQSELEFANILRKRYTCGGERRRQR